MKHARTLALVVVVLALLLAACQGAGRPPATPQPEAPGVLEGVLLEGAPDTPAADAAYDLHLPLPADPAPLTSFDEALGHQVLRIEVDVEFEADATVAQVNALLRAVDGRIVSMVRRAPIFLVRVPDPGDLDALAALVAEMERQPGVASALPSLRLQPEALPGGLDPGDAGDMTRSDHHLAVRAHAAWNLREELPASDARPWFVLGDWFGDGAPDDDYAAEVEAGDYDASGADDHGYHVLGIALGAYGPSAGDPDRDDVTGMFPASLRVRAADYANDATSDRIRNALLQRINDVLDEDADARIVVNTSLGFTSDPGVVVANGQARRWIGQVRANDLEDRFLHLTSAGNGGSGASVQRNSTFTYAALGTVTTARGTPMTNLTNILVIENRTNTLADAAAGALARPLPGCASIGSTMGGHLSAIGHRVWSFGSANTAAGASNQSGTSMATPQAAGLAAFVWALDPALDPQGVAALLRDTARALPDTTTSGNGTCNAVAPQPVIDAFDAVLAASGDAGRVRLLNATGGLPRFDHFDLEAFVHGQPAQPALDYGELDLNGDGVTDGGPAATRRDRLDLDGDGAFTPLARVLDGHRVAFDERALTDLEVACFYAHSPLYEGGALPRARLLATELRVGIAGPRTRYLRIERAPSGAPFVDDVALRGTVTPPRCADPFAVDAAELEWLDEAGARVGRGATHTLGAADLRGSGGSGFRARTLTLRYAAAHGRTAESRVTVIPCSDGEIPVVGEPQCPRSAGLLLESLVELFGGLPADTADEVQRAIHGAPEHRAVLERLGFEPCDPRFCDPFPPGFPHSATQLREGWYGDRGEVVAGHLDRLFKVLGSPSLEELDLQLATLQRAVAADDALSAADRELFATAAGVSLAAVELLAPEAAGGEHGWRAFAFADPLLLGERADPFAPAERALEGFLTAVVIANDRSGFAADGNLRAAAYALALEALRQAERVAQEAGAGAP